MTAVPGNILDRETSPYLLQHAGNPVHWQPWSAATLVLARQLGRPVLLSVGYAACHWCHVMAHESFENEETAALMNEFFVNVKVDREERPDIDAIYQSALAALGQQGGWPLTMFLTPDGEPFWGGTYFPPQDAHGRPGFPRVLRAVAEIYRGDRGTVEKNRAALVQALRRGSARPTAGELQPALLDEMARRLAELIDPELGGIAGAPKFPQGPLLDFLWRSYLHTGDQQVGHGVLVTLRQMAKGGIYDHLGGGFARYSTDERWLVPHFEKMLYDNAQLVELYTRAWAATGAALFADRVEGTVAWMLGEMRLPGGAFGASLDADSQGEEGLFYVWTADEIDTLLGPVDGPFFRSAFGVDVGGNWEGKSILNRLDGPDFLTPDMEDRLKHSRTRLLAARAQRPRPGFDDKVLAEWNGLAAAALAQAGAVFEQAEWLLAAEDAFDFVIGQMRASGRLHQSWRERPSPVLATLDAVAAMARAGIALYEATAQPRFLDAARSLASEAEAHYQDTDQGGFYFTATDAEALIVRTRSAADTATPSGNGIMVQVYAKLAALTGLPAYADKAERLVAAFAGAALQNFMPLTSLLSGYDMLVHGLEVVLVTTNDAKTGEEMRRAALRAPVSASVLTVAAGTDLPEDHPAFGRTLVKQPTAYVCRARTCSLPVTSAEALAALLAAGGDAPPDADA